MPTSWQIVGDKMRNWENSRRPMLYSFCKLTNLQGVPGWDSERQIAPPSFHSGHPPINVHGYGNIAPKTDIGKVVTIFYALLGIPLMLLCLTNIGDLLARSFKFTYSHLCFMFRKPRRTHASSQKQVMEQMKIALVEGWMVLLETAVVAVDGLGTCLFCDVDVTFRGRPLFRSGATGEVFMSLTGVKAEVW
ncbi:uncharacterized protein TNCV_4324551 [Trichonephila clavipes]|nr:uncharacterized protein TNCV_4324551 [Trichonephila clavipes]